jgi:hypothetical protein
VEQIETRIVGLFVRNGERVVTGDGFELPRGGMRPTSCPAPVLRRERERENEERRKIDPLSSAPIQDDRGN